KNRWAVRAALATVSTGISSWQSTLPLSSTGPSSAFAPGATTITFSPSLSTRISAIPVALPRESSSSMPASHSPASAGSAKSSSPTAPTKRTCAPSLAAATAWFAPFPPGWRSKVASVSVSPALGRRAERATRSRFAEPTTVSAGADSSGGKRAEILDRATEQVLAQVEEAGPERRAVRGRADPSRVAEAGQRAEEDRELQVRLHHPD